VFFYYSAAVLLLTAFPAAGQDAPNSALAAQLDRPYVSLLQATDFRYLPGETKSLRASIEQERKHEINSCEQQESNLREQLDSARRGLKDLNAASPSDTADMASARRSLHTTISALEKVVRDRKRECEQTIPTSFEIKLAKAHLLENWPDQRESTLRRIDQGHARERKHGDVEDIGYRKLVDDQEKDISVGEQAARQMASNKLMPLEIQEASVRQYVRSVAERIARNSDLKIPLHVTLLDSPDINAIGLPGGFLFLTSGLFLACETEAQFAGVISQQIAHIAARHGTRSSTRSVVSRFFVPATQVVTGVFTGGVSNAGAYYGMTYGFQGLQTLVDKALVSSNTKAQKEADQLGIQYAWKAGFDPKGFIAFLDSIAKSNDYSKSGSFFITKPPLGERLVDAFTEIEYLPYQGNYAVTSAEFRSAKERLISDNVRE
jgi:hypothetical protein